MIITIGTLDYTVKNKVRDILFDWMLECDEDTWSVFEAALNAGLREKVTNEVSAYYTGIGDVHVMFEDNELYEMYKSVA